MAEATQPEVIDVKARVISETSPNTQQPSLQKEANKRGARGFLRWLSRGKKNEEYPHQRTYGDKATNIDIINTDTQAHVLRVQNERNKAINNVETIADKIVPKTNVDAELAELKKQMGKA